VKSYAQRTAEQMRCPSGLSGLMAASFMKKYNAVAETWTVQQLQIAPEDHVLEIGFGPGCGLAEALSRMNNGIVEGIDTSPQMIRMASRLNKDALASGKLRLFPGDAARLPFKDETFDKVFAVNVYYFWKDADKPLSEIHRVLRQGGQVAIYLIERNDLLKMKQARTEVFSVPDDGDVVRHLEGNGFKGCIVNRHRESSRTGVCVLAYR
jgi:ubiquinone/menaquinone biosynthesis C-methylase UbiE